MLFTLSRYDSGRFRMKKVLYSISIKPNRIFRLRNRCEINLEFRDEYFPSLATKIVCFSNIFTNNLYPHTGHHISDVRQNQICDATYNGN